MEQNVSVCIPVYNGEDTIEAAIQSVLNQSYENLEIIVVDNASTDSTLQKIQRFDDNRIKVFVNESNLGMAGNWNKCLEYVTSEFVHFLCADDVMERDCIEKKVKAIQEPNTVMVYSSSELIDDKDEVLMKRVQYKSDRRFDGMKLAKKSFLSRNLYGEPSNVLFKAEVIRQVGGFSLDTCYVTDWEFWLRVSTLGDVAYLKDILVKYRVSNGNTTSKLTNKKMLMDDKVMVKKIEEDGFLKVSFLEKKIHHLMYFLRMYARNIYMRIKC